MLNRIAYLPKRGYRTLISRWTRDIYLVTDASNWILDRVGHNVAAYVQKEHKISTHLVADSFGLKNQIIHFVDRYVYFNGAPGQLHPSNHLFLTWFHGDLSDSNPAMQRLFTQLFEAAHSLERIVLSCRISKQPLVELGIPEDKLVMIPLGVDLTRFCPPSEEMRRQARHRLGVPEDAICIGSFQKDGSGWGEGFEPKLLKGPDVFLEVIATLAARYSNLLVLLTGPARGYVKQGLARLGVPYIYHFLDNYYDIVRYYYALDLYVIASRVEGGPAALLESWATGVPLVSTRVGMPADLIEHGQNGMLAEVEDVAGLAEYAVAFIEDSQLRENYRRCALADVQQYDWSSIAEQYYQKLYRPFLK